jgi:lipopolysaccharide export LptBFGC system permease protein LptF
MPHKTTIKFVNANEIFRYLVTSHFIVSTPFLFNFFIISVKAKKSSSSGFLACWYISLGKKPDELDFFALTDIIKKLKRNGVETIKWEVTRYLKISFAFTNLIVVLCGIPLVIIREKGEISFGAGASIFVIFGYYAFIKFGQSLGFKGLLSPIISAWIGNIVFLLIGIGLFLRSRT